MQYIYLYYGLQITCARGARECHSQKTKVTYDLSISASTWSFPRTTTRQDRIRVTTALAYLSNEIVRRAIEYIVVCSWTPSIPPPLVTMCVDTETILKNFRNINEYQLLHLVVCCGCLLWLWLWLLLVAMERYEIDGQQQRQRRWQDLGEGEGVAANFSARERIVVSFCEIVNSHAMRALCRDSSWSMESSTTGFRHGSSWCGVAQLGGLSPRFCWSSSQTEQRFQTLSILQYKVPTMILFFTTAIQSISLCLFVGS